MAATGKVGIGIIDTSEKLDINGNIRIRGTATDAPAEGKVLTCINSDGAAQWRTPGAGSGWTVEAPTMTSSPGKTKTLNNVEIGAGTNTNTREVLHVNGSATFNNDLATDSEHMTQLSINTDTKLDSVALTVGGPTYIGDWGTIESGAIDTKFLKNAHLWVKKGIVSEDFFMEKMNTWKDNVFESTYQLPSLGAVEAYIKDHKHLEGIPSASEVKENGYSLSQLDAAFLEKIENLVLYAIEQDKQIKESREQVGKLQQANDILTNSLKKLEERLTVIEGK